MTPQPNEIWLTESGRSVLIVEHPMTEVEGNLGFIWFDEVDNTMNFSPVMDQLKELIEGATIADWGSLMSHNTGQPVQG